MNDEYCCRLCQELVCAVVVNRSGVDSGELDYSLPIGKWSKQTLVSATKELDFLKNEILRRVDEICREEQCQT